jgi:hypothetical protein
MFKSVLHANARVLSKHTGVGHKHREHTDLFDIMMPCALEGSPWSVDDGWMDYEVVVLPMCKLSWLLS